MVSNLPKLNQNEAKRGRGRSRMGPRGLTWSQHGDKGRSTCWEDRFGHEKVANMAARWAPISRQNLWKIDAKIDQPKRCLSRSIFGAILVDLGRENGAKLAPKWGLKSILSWIEWKTENYCKTNEISMIFGVSGVQVGSKNRAKIDQKMRSTWEGILASIFDGFWWILGGKLGGKIEPRGIKNGIEKTMKKWRTARWQKNRNKKPWRP